MQVPDHHVGLTVLTVHHIFAIFGVVTMTHQFTFFDGLILHRVILLYVYL